jgi:heme oxygenase
MATVQTLFGTFDDVQLKALKGVIEEINHATRQIEVHNSQIKDIVDAAHDTFKIPKKIIKRIAKVQHNQSMQEEVAEFKEFEALVEGIIEVK